MYGLNDAPRKWFMKVVSVLSQLGFMQSVIHPALFCFKRGADLSGLLIVHVDDFLHAGDADFVLRVLPQLRKMFDVSTTGHSAFRYTGLNIKSFSDYVEIDQAHYIDALNCVPLPNSRKTNKCDLLTSSEKTEYRAAVGSLNWVSQQSLPDIMFEVLELSMRLKQPTVEDLIRANKCIKKVKLSDVHLIFRKLDLQNMALVSWSDAGFANLADRVSSGAGYVIFLVDKTGSCCPLVWRSNKVKRVLLLQRH